MFRLLKSRTALSRWNTGGDFTRNNTFPRTEVNSKAAELQIRSPASRSAVPSGQKAGKGIAEWLAIWFLLLDITWLTGYFTVCLLPLAEAAALSYKSRLLRLPVPAVGPLPGLRDRNKAISQTFTNNSRLYEDKGLTEHRHHEKISVFSNSFHNPFMRAWPLL